MNFTIPILENLKNKFAKEKVSVGVDIGTSSIKIVKLKFANAVAQLQGLDLIPITAGLDAALKELSQSDCIKDINISVSGHSTIIRYVNFAKMNGEELKQALKFEAQKLIPFSINEINLDSYILKPDLPDNKMLILLAAVKKEFVDERLKLLNEAGIKVNVIDIDSLSLINAFNFSHSSENDDLKNKTVALLNIGASISNLNLLENSLPCLSRDIKIAGSNFTKKIADALSIDAQSAENLKNNPPKEKMDKISQALEPVITSLATEIRISFDYYESQGSSTVSKIYLSGGGSVLFCLKDILGSILDIGVEYWDPLANIDVINPDDLQKITPIGGSPDLTNPEPGINQAKLFSAQLPVAVGLALRQ